MRDAGAARPGFLARPGAGCHATATPPTAAAAIGLLVPQACQLYGELTCQAFLTYAATLKELEARAIRLEVSRVLAAVHLTRVARRRISTLSVAMQQRVGLAQALLGQPRVLLLDDPVAGLYREELPEEREYLRNLLAALAEHCLIVLATPIIEDIAQICSHVAVLQRGRLLYHGSREALAALPRGRIWDVDTLDRLVPGTLLLGIREEAPGMCYRLWAHAQLHPDARPVAASTLLDSYRSLGHQTRASLVHGSGASGGRVDHPPR